MATPVSNFDNIIDTRDLTSYIEEVGEELLITYNAGGPDNQKVEDHCDDIEDVDFIKWLDYVHNDLKLPGYDDLRLKVEEFLELTDFANNIKEYATDYEHGEMLISEDYFTDYCKDMLQDIGDLPKDLPSYIAIDWEKTADNLKVDYSEADLDGVTYLFRSC